MRIETKRSSGAGGQHVNTTDSCVRVTHIPTGLSVECQTEREQFKNKRNALARLRALLFQKKQDEQDQKLKETRKSQVCTLFCTILFNIFFAVYYLYFKYSLDWFWI